MSKFWNELVKDGEIASSALNPKCGEIAAQKGDSGKAECVGCGLVSSLCDGDCLWNNGSSCTTQKEKEQPSGNLWDDEGRNYQPSDDIIDSWTWGEQLTISGLSEAVRSLMVEQKELTAEAASTTSSSIRLQQRLIVLQRYYNAYVPRSNLGPLLGFGNGEKEMKMNTGQNEKNSR